MELKDSCCWILSQARWMWSTFSHLPFWRSILILSSHVQLSFQMVSLVQVFQQNCVFMSHLSHMCYILFEPITSLIHGKDYKLYSCLLQFSLASSCFLSLRSKYSLQCLVLKHLQSASSLNIRDQVSHMKKVMRIITVMCVFYLIFVVLDRRKDVKFEEVNSSKHCPDLISV
jgi:hypothetical protein